MKVTTELKITCIIFSMFSFQNQSNLHQENKSFQKFPNFIFEKVTKLCWKIVVKLVEFMVGKRSFQKFHNFIVEKATKIVGKLQQNQLNLCQQNKSFQKFPNFIVEKATKIVEKLQ